MADVQPAEVAFTNVVNVIVLNYLRHRIVCSFYNNKVYLLLIQLQNK